VESKEYIPSKLRYQIRILGELLGETLANQYDDVLLRKVEEIRGLSKSRRIQGSHLKADLVRVLNGLKEQELVPVVRAFNQFLNLSNIAEQVQTISRENISSTKGSFLEQTFNNLKSTLIADDDLANAVKHLHCDLVLTANPTEITSRTLIQKYDRIANLLQGFQENSPDKSKIREQLKQLVAEIWHTDEMHADIPTPQEEAKWGFAVIENSFWYAVPQVWRDLDNLLFDNTGRHMPIDFSPISISSWLGGDRHNNPAATADATRDVLRLSRWMAADLYLRDIEILLSRLSMSQCNDELRELAGAGQHEPYRFVLRELRSKLENTRIWTEQKTADMENLALSKKDLFEPLYACYQSLCECNMAIIANGELKDTLIRVACFGVTLVDLDIRESSKKHVQLLDELTQHLNIGSYRDWSESKRQKFLLAELASKRPLLPNGWEPSEKSIEVLKTFQLIADTNAEGISSYVVSRAQEPSDILEVILLFRTCGLKQSVPVVPLFETLDDLDQAEDTLLQLFKIPDYREHIGKQQQVMIDYTDSAKDAGQMAAAWAQYRAQEALVKVCDKYEIDLLLFHGRDGSTGRGGGSTQHEILSRPSGTIRHGMRVCEQGETIRFKYGTPGLAVRNLDYLLSATLQAMALPSPKPDLEWRRTMDHLSEIACSDYNQVTREDEKFISYFEQATPAMELSELTQSVQEDVLSDTESSSPLDRIGAIPWIFSWTQKRLLLPAWLGSGTALKYYQSPEQISMLQDMLENWPFFRYQIDSLEMALAKTDLEISSDYDAALVSPELQQMADSLNERVKQLIGFVNTLKKQDKLLAGSPQITASIAVRSPYSDPLHFLQMELMSRRRKHGSHTNANVSRALLVTIAGIAAGMRNSA
jgi:phosphoenolpyruvate carboxylase